MERESGWVGGRDECYVAGSSALCQNIEANWIFRERVYRLVREKMII